MPITTRQLALRRSTITLTVVRTQPLVQAAGPNLVTGFNNTYIGNFVGSLAGTPDESDTIRIGDISNGNGAGSVACYIGGIWNNPQPVGGSVVVVTLNTDTDELGIDTALGRSGELPAPHRSAPQPRVRPDSSNHAMLNQKVEQLQATVTQQQATVAQQQKQIEALTTQLREQAAQIQKVSAQLEIDPSNSASCGESIRLLSRSAVREVSVSSIQIQPPREPARRLFCCTVAASLCEAPIPTRA